MVPDQLISLSYTQLIEPDSTSYKLIIEIGFESEPLGNIIALIPTMILEGKSKTKIIEKIQNLVKIDPYPITIGPMGTMYVENLNREISLNPLQKLLYIFYLLHPNGIRRNELMDHKNCLAQIYGRLSNSSSPDKIQESISLLIDPFHNSFNEKRSKINSTLKEVIPKRIVDLYLIQGTAANPYFISLPREKVNSLYRWKELSTTL